MHRGSKGAERAERGRRRILLPAQGSLRRSRSRRAPAPLARGTSIASLRSNPLPYPRKLRQGALEPAQAGEAPPSRGALPPPGAPASRRRWRGAQAEPYASAQCRTTTDRGGVVCTFPASGAARATTLSHTGAKFRYLTTVRDKRRRCRSLRSLSVGCVLRCVRVRFDAFESAFVRSRALPCVRVRLRAFESVRVRLRAVA